MAEIRYSPGRMVWHEIFTRDPVKAGEFYGRVVGWRVETVDMGGTPYPMLMVGEEGVGGISRIPDDDTYPAHWGSYVSVADVDLASARAVELGGTLAAPPTDIPVGRFATIMDPLGGVISLFKSRSGDGPEVQPSGVGQFCWDQLNSPSPEVSAEFYRQVVGWGWAPYPGGGPLSLFLRGQHQAATLMTAPPGVRAHWLTYIQVENLAEARDRVVAGGGGIMVAEIPVPGMGVFGVLRDPEGAIFALFQPS